LKRALDPLHEEPFDIVVIGAGILGASIARDAALRGLSVALVEKRDFGAQTSANSLKLIHGGLRYLQHLDLARMRSSIRERSVWLRIAPHLVEPLPFVVPTSRSGLHRKTLLRAALQVNDMLSRDRNSGVPEERHIPAGRALSRNETLELVPELESRSLTGGVMFHDALMYSAERLVLAVIQGAHAAGAVVANYVEIQGRRSAGTGVTTLAARDHRSGSSFEVHARLVVNAAGPAAPTLAARLLGHSTLVETPYSLALNLVFPAREHRVAFTLPSSSRDPNSVVHTGSRQLLVVPWRQRSLIGTAHYPLAGRGGDLEAVEDGTVERFLAEINQAWPEAAFDAAKLEHVHAGLLPTLSDSGSSPVRLLKRHRVVDHGAEGAPWLISAVSVKYTTARLVAEEVVDHLFTRRGSTPPPCRTSHTLLPGAPASVAELLAAARRNYGELLEGEVLEHLVRSYGTGFPRVLDYRRTLPRWDERVEASAPVIRAQLVHSAATEMVCCAEDLVLRRTELGPRGLASDAALAAAAEALAAAPAPAG
jgi:glycerol-3-phosphate dehydrogenase